jgi:hypothetical protein
MATASLSSVTLPQENAILVLQVFSLGKIQVEILGYLTTMIDDRASWTYYSFCYRTSDNGWSSIPIGFYR